MKYPSTRKVLFTAYTLASYVMAISAASSDSFQSKLGNSSGQMDHGRLKGFKYLGRSVNENDGKKTEFFLSQDYKSQGQALMDCVKIFNGQLLDIPTEAKDNLITTFLERQTTIIDRVHTSGKYNDLSRTWEWYTMREAFVFTNWDRFHGDPADNACCSKTGKYDDFTWHSHPCTERNLFICEYELN